MAGESKSSRSFRQLPDGIRSKYELVVAAAKEAERLNDYYRNRGGDLPEKVTMLALRRIEKGLSKILYEDPDKASEDQQRRDTTFFFGS
jgi:DNA-directed RNA polymerase omega subunit